MLVETDIGGKGKGCTLLIWWKLFTALKNIKTSHVFGGYDLSNTVFSFTSSMDNFLFYCRSPDNLPTRNTCLARERGGAVVCLDVITSVTES